MSNKGGKPPLAPRDYTTIKEIDANRKPGFVRTKLPGARTPYAFHKRPSKKPITLAERA
jgi:hypothetical protein